MTLIGLSQRFSIYLTFNEFKPSSCKNPQCANRQRFNLDLNNSKFVDFQKVRAQEIQSELPRGCIPRSLEVILRAECVEKTQAGDRCEFIGTLIVVPDVSKLSSLGIKITFLSFIQISFCITCIKK